MREKKAGWDRCRSQPLFLSVSAFRKYGAAAFAQGTHAQPAQCTHACTQCSGVFPSKIMRQTLNSVLRLATQNQMRAKTKSGKDNTPRTWAANRLSAKGWSRRMLWNATNAENISSCHAHRMQEVQRCMNKCTHMISYLHAREHVPHLGFQRDMLILPCFIVSPE
jgi:hypothetical protein